jgi:hypothetical protein
VPSARGGGPGRVALGFRSTRIETRQPRRDGRGSVRLVVPEPVPDHRRELSCEGGDRHSTATVTSMSGIGLSSLAHSSTESGTSGSFFRRKPPASRSPRATRVRLTLTTRRCSESYRPALRMRRSGLPSPARTAWPHRPHPPQASRRSLQTSRIHTGPPAPFVGLNDVHCWEFSLWGMWEPTSGGA